MKMKKLTALLLAGLMAMSLVTSAFATSTNTVVNAENINKAANVAVTSVSVLPTIKLTVPQAASVILNPYGMTIKQGEDSKWVQDDEGTITDSILSAPTSIVSESTVKIAVGVTATGKVPTGVTFATKSAATVVGKDKQVFVKLQMITAKEALTTVSSEFDDVPAAQEMILSSTAATLKTPIVLAATDGETGTAEDTLVFRFTGDVSKSPTTPWSDKDTVGATLAFTFTPQFEESE